MKRSHGEGSIQARGVDTWRIRYRVDGERIEETIKGSRQDATKALRQRLKSADDGQHVAPDKLTLRSWIEAWLELKQGLKARSQERYSQLLRVHVLPTLGDKPLQSITAVDIDRLYLGLKMAPGSKVFLHVVLMSCFGSAVKKRLIPHNPVADAEKPRSSQEEAATILDEEEMKRLLAGFEGRALYGIVALALMTGMRRNEILALRWTEVDLGKAQITVRWNLEETKAFGRRVVSPKSKKGLRTFEIDAGLVAILQAERPSVDVSLLPEALVFPSPGTLTKLRSANSASHEFMDRAKELGFDIRFHDCRASHETALLDRGLPVHVVAARCGHDAAILLKAYAKRTKKSDTKAAEMVAAMGLGPRPGPDPGLFRRK